MPTKIIQTKDARIELKLDKLKTLLEPKKIVNKPVVRDLGRNIKKESLALVAVGKSPVKGEGRFKGYAAQRGAPKAAPRKPRGSARPKGRLAKLIAKAKRFLARSAKKQGKTVKQVTKELSGRYPEIASLLAKYPRKKTRPVNLFLDGTYLDFITESKINKERDGIEYGAIGTNLFLEILFEVHNEGARNDIPRRMVVPTGGKDFTASIRRKIKDIYLKRIRSIIRSA